RHVLETLDRDGTWLIVEPFAHDHVEDNLNPIGRLLSAASTTICVPASLAEHGPALGGQAGEARIRAVVTQAGLTRFRRAARVRPRGGAGRRRLHPGRGARAEGGGRGRAAGGGGALGANPPAREGPAGGWGGGPRRSTANGDSSPRASRATPSTVNAIGCQPA